MLDANGRLFLYQEDVPGSATVHGNGTINTAYSGWRPVSPIICGFADDLTDNDMSHNSCVIWSPPQMIGNSALGETLYSPIEPVQLMRCSGQLAGLPELFTVNAAITFDETTKPYEICTKVIASPYLTTQRTGENMGGRRRFPCVSSTSTWYSLSSSLYYNPTT